VRAAYIGFEAAHAAVGVGAALEINIAFEKAVMGSDKQLVTSPYMVK
jgi:hypothetical protein